MVSNCKFSGHGGSRAADYVKQHLFKNLLNHPQFVTDTKLAIGMQFSVIVLSYLSHSLLDHTPRISAVEYL